MVEHETLEVLGFELTSNRQAIRQFIFRLRNKINHQTKLKSHHGTVVK